MNGKEDERLNVVIANEISQAKTLEDAGNYRGAFHHLERAHVLGQASTYQHTRVHLKMLKLAFKLRSVREIWGQLIRILGASTKTPLGIYPTGNTGGANVWFFQSMPVPDDLQKVLKNR